ncbi:MAG: hypothetical protein ACRDS9_18515 [Pseudonocardiaceae bacterium]
MSAPRSGRPLIDSPAAAAEALRDYFLANADRDDNAANDELVAELVRRIRIHQTSRELELLAVFTQPQTQVAMCAAFLISRGRVGG